MMRPSAKFITLTNFRRPTILPIVATVVIFFTMFSLLNEPHIQKIEGPDAESGIRREKGPGFNKSRLRSHLPTLHDLYPGGFSSPAGLSTCPWHVSLLVVVHSARAHTDRRDAIRTTWASIDVLPPNVRVVFLIGDGTTSTETQLESTNDVIISHFTDSYRNLTLKTVAMLDWVHQNCPQIKYLLKCDDDVYVNINKLLSELDKNYNYSNDVIIGKLAHGWKPIRNAKSKYHISVEEFSQSVLPNFTTGPAYLLAGRQVPRLFEAALREPWLPLEDVFLTGVVAGARLGIELVHWPAFLNNRATLTVCNAQRLIAIHNVRPNEHSKLMRLSKLSNRSCQLRDQLKNHKEQIKQAPS